MIETARKKGLLVVLWSLAIGVSGDILAVETATDNLPADKAATVRSLAEFPPEERARREEIIRKLSDANYVLAPWVRNAVLGNDPLRDGFVPQGSDLRDFSIVHDKGRYHVFYIDIRHGKSSRQPDNFTFIGHASTPDFQHYEVHEPMMHVVPGTWEGGHIGPPYVFPVARNTRFGKMAGFPVRFVCVYTGISGSLAQSTGMAFSNDLFHWVRYDGNPILQPAHFGWAVWSRTTLSNCRDPFVLQLKDRYLLYYTALQKDGDMCVAAAESANLEDWKDLGPVHVRPFSEVSPAMLESSCVHGIGDRFVLFYTHKGGTRYVISDSPTRFPNREADMLIAGYWNLELIKKLDNRWLVGVFKAQTASDVGRLFLGILTWQDYRPTFTLAKRPEDIAIFLASP
jgi:hypothetical protein